MNKSDEILEAEAPANVGGKHNKASRHILAFLLTTCVLVLCFSRPLYALLHLAARSELYSHILLVPFISAYLVWMNRKRLPSMTAPDFRTALIFSSAALAVYTVPFVFNARMGLSESLTCAVLSFVFLFIGVCGCFLGRSFISAITFPLGFLLFLTPFPTFLIEWIETGLQYGSAARFNPFD